MNGTESWLAAISLQLTMIILLLGVILVRMR